MRNAVSMKQRIDIVLTWYGALDLTRYAQQRSGIIWLLWAIYVYFVYECYGWSVFIFANFAASKQNKMQICVSQPTVIGRVGKIYLFSFVY